MEKSKIQSFELLFLTSSIIYLENEGKKWGKHFDLTYEKEWIRWGKIGKIHKNQLWQRKVMGLFQFSDTAADFLNFVIKETFLADVSLVEICPLRNKYENQVEEIDISSSRTYPFSRMYFFVCEKSYVKVFFSPLTSFRKNWKFVFTKINEQRWWNNIFLPSTLLMLF